MEMEMFKTLMAVLAAAFMFAVLLALTGVIPLTSLVVFTAVLLLGAGLAVFGRRLIVWLAAFSVAAALSGCVSPGIITGAAAPGKGAKAQSEAELAALKEVNRHIELCDRTYGWPFTAVITCKASGAPSAETISEMIDKAVAKAIAAIRPPAAP
jgi:hypothetical protein